MNELFKLSRRFIVVAALFFCCTSSPAPPQTLSVCACSDDEALAYATHATQIFYGEIVQAAISSRTDAELKLTVTTLATIFGPIPNQTQMIAKREGRCAISARLGRELLFFASEESGTSVCVLVDDARFTLLGVATMLVRGTHLDEPQLDQYLRRRLGTRAPRERIDRLLFLIDQLDAGGVSWRDSNTVRYRDLTFVLGDDGLENWTWQ